MIRIRLKGKPKVDLSRVFRKAVRGYKKISKVYAGKKYGSVQFPQQIELKAPAIIETAKKKGIEIVPKTYFRAEIKGEEMDKTKVNIIYPLIPRKPAKGQQVFAYANIKWSPRENALVYYLIEPALSDTEKELLNQIKSTLIERLDVDFAALKKGEAKDYLRKRFEEAVKVMAPLPQQKQQQLLYYIERDFIGLERIEPLMQDTNIEDVSCDGVGIPIYIYHRDPTIGSIRTNVVFENKEYLDSFVNKLTQRCGKTISVASPLVDASLPDGSRLQATLGTDIARRGSNFCIKEGLVQMSNGSIYDIKELFEKYKSEYGCTQDDYGNEIVEPHNLKVAGVEESSLKQEDAKVVKIIKLRPPERLVKVELKESGKTTSSIEVTENHKFHVLTEEGIKTIPANRLKPEMWIPVPTKINIISNEDFNGIYLNSIKNALLNHKESNVHVKINGDIKPLIIYLDTYKSRLKNIKRYKTSSITFKEFLDVLDKSGKNLDEFSCIECILRKGQKGRGSKIKIPLKFTEEFAYLIGWIIGDGSVTKDNISIDTGLNEDYKEKLLDLIFNVFNVKGKCYKNSPSRIYINSKILSNLLHDVFSLPIGKKAKIVDVPKIIEMTPENILANFIRGLFESDGSFRNCIQFTTFSEKLANKITFLLTRLGIYSNFYRDKKTFRIFVPAEYYEKFGLKIINNRFVQELIKKHDSTKKSKMLPAFYAKLLFDVLREKKVKWKEISKIINITDTLQRGKVSFEKIKELNEYVKKFEENKLTKLIDYFTSGNFEFMEIANVEVKENLDNCPVYDIECNPVNFYIGGKNRPMFLHDTVRKFTEEPLTPVHMLKFGTMDAKILAYLWLMAEHGKSTLIAGGTASGKTSLLNALSLFIRPELKIVSIEDTPELRLPHPHWVPQVARQPIAEVEGRKLGEVDMFDLLRESLRQRPDYIIVGEVRGKEAYVLFQQIATGHAGYATIHADTMEKLVDRLTTPPISLPASLIENLDSIVFIVRVKRGDVYVRRVYSVQEVVGFDRERNLPVTNEIFRWDAGRDVFATVNPSIVVKNISDQTGFSEASLQNNIGLKIKVLEWMLKNNITDYRTFAGIMKLYYTNQERLAELMERY